MFTVTAGVLGRIRLPRLFSLVLDGTDSLCIRNGTGGIACVTGVSVLPQFRLVGGFTVLVLARHTHNTVMNARVLPRYMRGTAPEYKVTTNIYDGR